MIKLYWRADGETHYWEAWSEGRTVIVHWGELGDTGKTHEIRLAKGESADEVIERESRLPRADGHQEIPIEEHAVLVVQYQTKGWGSARDLDKRHKVESILDECLGWTGNGHCDGGDIGSGTINAFSFVVDPQLAKETVVDALEERRLLNGAVIAFRQGDEEYTVLWPEDFQGEFSE